MNEPDVEPSLSLRFSCQARASVFSIQTRAAERLSRSHWPPIRAERTRSAPSSLNSADQSFCGCVTIDASRPGSSLHAGRSAILSLPVGNALGGAPFLHQHGPPLGISIGPWLQRLDAIGAEMAETGAQFAPRGYR